MASSASPKTSAIIGVLLAAGRGARFDPTGSRNKLMQSLPGGDGVALASARNMLAILPRVVAVVRPGADALAVQLQGLGCEVTVCANAEQGMGASLVHALRQESDAAAWIIGLADMPYVQPATIEALVDAVEHGADIAVPIHQQRRGNPVAFGKAHLVRLLALGGDEGARTLLKSCAVTEVAVDDGGIHRDIDTESDLDAAS